MIEININDIAVKVRESIADEAKSKNFVIEGIEGNPTNPDQYNGKFFRRRYMDGLYLVELTGHLDSDGNEVILTEIKKMV